MPRLGLYVGLSLHGTAKALARHLVRHEIRELQRELRTTHAWASGLNVRLNAQKAGETQPCGCGRTGVPSVRAHNSRTVSARTCELTRA